MAYAWDWLEHKIDPNVHKHFHYGATHDPLVLDLGAKGIQTTAADGSVLADFSGSGVKHGTGWVGPQDGFLVMDRNGDGKIELSQDLFGGHTLQQASEGLGVASAALGVPASSNDNTKLTAFQELKLLDSNGDGVIDKNDANFSKLKVWQDTNQDGVVESGELKSLTDLGITSISLKGDRKTQDLGNGNSITSSATFTYSDGTTSTISALNLAQNNFYRQFETPVTVPDSLKGLPDMQGSGAVRDLQQAAAQSPALADTLTKYANATSASEQAGMLDDLIEKWADSSKFKNFVQRIDAMHGKVFHWEFDIVPPSTTSSSGSGSGGTVTSVSSSGGGSGYGGTMVTLPSGPKLVSGTDLHVGLFPTDDKIQALAKIKVLEVFNDEKFFNFTPQKNSQGQYSGGLSELCGVHTWGSSAAMVPINHTIYVTNKNLEFGAPQEKEINKAYDELKGSIYRSLLTQTRFKPYLNAIGLSLDSQNNVQLDFSKLNTMLGDRISHGGAAGMEDFLEFMATAGRKLLGLGWKWGQEKAAELITPQAIENAGPTMKYVLAESGQDGLILGKTVGQSLRGGNSADILVAGAGNETLNGGGGADTYVLGAGSGWSTVRQNDTDGIGTIAFNNKSVAEADAVLTKVGDDLKIAAGKDGFTVKDWFKSSQYQVSQFVFADGTVVSAADLLAKGVHDNASGWRQTVNGLSGKDIMVASGYQSTVNGLGGDDVLSSSDNSNQDHLNGGAGNDTLYSGGGGDILDGGTGNDAYVLQSGTGWDTVVQADAASTDQDMIQFADKSITQDSLVLTKVGDGLDIKAGDSGFHLNNWFKGSQYQVSQFQFADGTKMSASDLLAQGVHDNASGWRQTVNGWSGKDFMVASGYQSTVNGLSGDDVLSSTDNSNQDYLNGGAGNDTLYSGGGGDILDGGTGNDTYVLKSGTGWDTIHQADAASSDQDTIAFANKSVTKDSLVLTKVGNDLKIGAGKDGFTVKDWFKAGTHKISQFKFADGSAVSAADLLAQGVHDKAGGWRQTVNGWSGKDTMVASGYQSTVNGLSGDDVLSSTDNSNQDHLNGGAGNDTLYGGKGGDILNGGAGSDTYIFSGDFGSNTVVGDTANPNSEDKAKFTGIEPDQLWFQKQGSDLLANVIGTGGKVDFQGWFADNRNKLGSIQLDGKTASSADIDKLVNAMAAFDPPSGAGAVMTSAEKTALQPVLAESWHAVS